ncbi:hypothetical protein INT45_000394 [Circinella minor]|uniref:Uncharacterized protein n=1 Tax=Circinella minor TaxID=1195481 RepID=A0A8H7RVF6_9FUNG|nr:hypothetical protein INT45_000394 [Circinella minor]
MKVFTAPPASPHILVRIPGRPSGQKNAQVGTTPDVLKKVYAFVSKFFWHSAQGAWVSSNVLAIQTGEIRSLPVPNESPHFLLYDIVASLEIEYQELPRNVSSIELVNFLKRFKNLKISRVWRIGLSFQKNIAGIRLALVKKHPSIKIIFEKIEGHGEQLDNPSRFICNTSPMNGSLSNILKRSFDDYYTTPENLHCIDTDYYGNEGQFGGYDMKRYWKRQKLDQIEQGRCSPRNHPIHTLIKIPRALDKLNTGSLAIHIDVFIAREPHVDDCGHKRIVESLTSVPEAKLLEQRDFGNPYYQFVIRWGPLEMLVISGYYGKLGDTRKTAFTGSSLPINIAKELSRERNGFAVTIPV